MAAGRIVISEFAPARDRNDALVAGAKMYVYTNGTTTLASIYTSATLATALANPVVANSSGQFAQVWADNTLTYTVSITGPNGESIGNPSVFDDYSPSTNFAVLEVEQYKSPVRVASTANITIASALINGSTIDGVVVATGDRVLLKDQSTGSQNGIYVVVASGAASRSGDADISADVTSGMTMFVSEGTANGGAVFTLTTANTITLGTTTLTFSRYSGILPVANGGTGASTASAARTSLDAEVIQTFDTRAIAGAATINSAVTIIQVSRYSTSCPICPAVYKEVTDSGTLEAWQFRSNGATRRWELAEAVPVDVMLGVVGDGVTNDAAATNTFLGYVESRFGVSQMYPGSRLFSSQVTLTRATARAVEIIANGVKIKTTTAISGFKVTGSYFPLKTVIRGMTVEDDNASATAGFEQTNTGYVAWPECVCTSNGDAVSATYRPWWLHQSNTADPNTGNFWTDFRGAAVRRTGTAYLPRAVTLQGAANATSFRGFSMGGVVDGVAIINESGQTYLANGVSCEEMWVEGVTGKMVRVIGDAGQVAPEGLVVGNNRYEAINTVLSVEGVTLSAYSVTRLYQDGLISADVTTLINNPNDVAIAVSINDRVAAARNISINKDGHVLRETGNAYDVLELRASTVGRGLALTDSAGTAVHGTLRYVASGVMELAGNYDLNRNLMLSSVGGLSKRLQRAANFAGQATIGGGGTVTVTLDYAEADISYGVHCAVRDAARACGYGTKTTTNFVLTGTAGDVIDWLLVRI